MDRLDEQALARLEAQGLATLAPGPGAWRLDAAGELLVVAAGRVELFAQSSRAGQAAGHRRHLLTFGPGEVVPPLGLPAGDWTAVAVAAGGCRLLSAGRLRALPVDVQGMLLQCALAGLCRQAAALAGSDLADVAVLLAPGPATALDAGTRAGLAEPAGWVRVLRGEALLLGEAPFDAAGGPLPLARGLWLQAGPGGAELGRLEAADDLDPGRLVELLDRYAAVLMGRAARRLPEQDDRQIARLAATAAAEAALRAQALTELAQMRPRPGPAGAPADDALLAACQRLGAACGISFCAPPDWIRQTAALEPLAALCRASRVRHRQVALHGRWWQTDNGPMLAFQGPERVPVALLPRPLGGYDLCGPAHAAPLPVDAALAGQLEPAAFTFYRPAPAGPLTAWDLLRLAWTDLRRDLGWVLVMALAGGLLSLVLPVLTGRVLGDVIPQADARGLGLVFLAMLAVAGAGALFDLTRGWALLRLRGRAGAGLQATIMDRVLSLPAGFFRDFTVGDLVARAGAVDQIQDTLTGSLISSILSGLFASLNLVLLFVYSAQLALVGVALAAVAWTLYLVFGWLALRVERRRQDAAGRISGQIFQMLNGINKLRVAGGEGRAFSVWCRALAGERGLRARGLGLTLPVRVLNQALSPANRLILFAVAGVGARGLPPGQFVAFLMAVSAFFRAAVAVSGTLIDVLAVKPLLERARPILQAVPEDGPEAKDPGRLSGRVEARRLCFRYQPGGPLILDDVSFEAAPGEFIALVGPSGSGKSSALRLLMGFERAESGSVLYDRQDLDDLDKGRLRSQLGVVLQTSRLMAGSIFQNIAGTGTLTLDDAWAAAEAAGLAELIRALPMGMHTMVSEGGSTFSGGQRQRLLIARALVRKPRILLFDEATSALDNRTQGQVSAGIERLNATRIVIAHRLSTIRQADRIYVVEAGRVSQVGRFEELAARPGLFRELAARQEV